MNDKPHWFAIPKKGSAKDEYEDAHYFKLEYNSNNEFVALRLAVADGATETSFSVNWAQLLVRSYCRGNLEVGKIDATLRRLAAIWRKQIGDVPLPWYAEEKLSEGAFAALAGIRLVS